MHLYDHMGKCADMVGDAEAATPLGLCLRDFSCFAQIIAL